MMIDRITIAVKDVGTMVAFYNAVFASGLQAIPETPFYQGTLGKLELVFCPNSLLDINAERSLFQLRLQVEDTDGMVAHAKAVGGSEYGERYADAQQIAWGFADPDGNTFEVYQRLGSSDA